MKGNSSKKPLAIERINTNKYRIRWNIKPFARPARMGIPEMQGFEFDYNSNYYPVEISKKEIMLAIIREKYDANDELSIALRRIGDNDKYQAHEDWVNFARTTADAILAAE
jgi:hypothetical protein